MICPLVFATVHASCGRREEQCCLGTVGIETNLLSAFDEDQSSEFKTDVHIGTLRLLHRIESSTSEHSDSRAGYSCPGRSCDAYRQQLAPPHPPITRSQKLASCFPLGASQVS